MAAREIAGALAIPGADRIDDRDMLLMGGTPLVQPEQFHPDEMMAAVEDARERVLELPVAAHLGDRLMQLETELQLLDHLLHREFGPAGEGMTARHDRAQPHLVLGGRALGRLLRGIAVQHFADPE